MLIFDIMCSYRKRDEEIAKELQNGNKSNVGTNTKDK